MKNKVLKKLFAFSTAMLMIFNTGMSNISMVYANEGINETTVQAQNEEQSVEPVETTEVNTGDAQVVGTPEDNSNSDEQATQENLGNEPNEVTQEDLDAKGIPAKVLSQTDNTVTLALYPGATMKDVYYRSANTRDVPKYTLTLETPYGVADDSTKWWHVNKHKPTKNPTTGATYYYDVYAHMTINGKKAYCVQPNTMALHGVGDYTKVSFGDYGFSSEIEEKIKYIQTLGYGFDGDTSEYMDWATQIAIWNVVDPGNIYGVDSEVQKKVDLINSRMDVLKYRVSFLDKTISLDGIGDSYAQTVTDTNKVFQHYVTGKGGIPDGVEVVKNGNSLTVWATKPVSTAKPIIYNAFYFKDKAYTGTTAIYDSPNHQDVVTVDGIPDPPGTGLKVKTNLVKPLTIGKQDEDKKWVPNTAFHVAYGSDMSQLLVNPNSTNPDDKYEFKTGSDGKVTVPSAYIQGDKIYGIEKTTVYVQEVGVPEHLVLDKTIHTVNLKRASEDGENYFNAENRWVKGKIKVVKKDKESGKVITIANSTFRVYKKDTDALVATITTGADGTATTGYLRYGEYYVKETDAPDRYLIDKDQVIEVFIKENDKVYENNFYDQRIKAKLTINKKDEVTGSTPQGDATLQGAVFNLRAKSDIKDPADGSVLVKKDQVVRTLTTNANGYAETDGELYLGEYYLEEKSEPKGYLWSDITWNITFDDPGETTPLVEKHQDFTNRVKSAPFSLMKYFTDPETGRSYPLDGVEFTVKLKSEVDAKGWNNAPLAKNDQGKIAKILITNENGYAESERLPYGVYIVRETGGYPSNVTPSKDMEVTIDVDQEKPLPWITVENKPTKGYLRIQKKDSDTGKLILIPGATFKVKDLKTNTYYSYYDLNTGTTVSSWTTDKTGQVALPQRLDRGDYQIEEIATPKGFLIDKNPVKFTVKYTDGGETHPQTGDPVITVVKSNKEVHGKITVEKTGEVLTGAIRQSNGNYKFVYETKKLPNAEFEVYAEEVIKSQDGQGTVLYNKDQLVTTLKTGADGTAQTGELPLGKYYVKESKAPHGMVDTDVVKHVELLYKDDITPLVFDSASFHNDRQKVVVNASKKDADTNGYVKGAEFTMVNDTAIKSYTGITLIPAGTEIEKVLTGDDGKAEFTSDLPVDAKVHVNETKAPDGYASTDVTFNIDTAYKDSSVKTQVYSTNFVNAPTVWEFTKEDITSNKEINGAHMSVIDSKGTVVDSWVSDRTKPHVIKYLLVGQTYTLREDLAPTGYLQANEIKFTIMDTGEIQSVVMRDEHVKGRISVKKLGESLVSVSKGSDGNYKFNYEIKPQKNAVFSVYAAEDIKHPDGQSEDFYKKGQKVTTLTTGVSGEAFTDLLPLGKYYIKEDKAPDGLVHNDERKDVELKYVDQTTALVFDSATFDNERQKVEISNEKTDFDTKEHVEGAQFTLYAEKDIIGYDGSVLMKKGTAIETVTTDKGGKSQFKADLPLSIYSVKETKAPIGYASTDASFAYDASYKGQTVKLQEYSDTFVNKPTHWEFTKSDITSSKEIDGAQMSVTDKDGKVVDEWVSSKDEAHVIKYLHVGETYTLKEVLAPNGYLQAKEIKFTILDTGEVQKLDMTDEHVHGKITVKKLGENLVGVSKDSDGNLVFNYETMPQKDATFEIYASADIKHPDKQSEDYYKAGDLVATLVTGEDGTATTEELPLGKYYVVEKQAPNGFVINRVRKEVDLVYKDQVTPLVFNSAEYDNDRQKIEIATSKKDADTNLLVAGAEFTLYADVDIKNYKGEVVVKKGTAIEKVVTGEDGRAVFKADLPLSKYSTKETKAPIGYASTDVTFNHDATYKGQDILKQTFSANFVNEPTVWEFTKKDITSYNEIDGAQMSVIDKDGKVVDEWVSSSKESHIIKYLHVGEEYTLKEVLAPEGYLQATEIKFVILDTGEIQSVVMMDEHVRGKISVTKTGESLTSVTKDEDGNLVFNYTEEVQKDAIFEVYAAEDIKHPDKQSDDFYKKDDLVATLITGVDGKATTEDLPLGKYYVIERTAPNGFVNNSLRKDVELKYKDQYTALVYDSTSFKNERQKASAQVTKKDVDEKVALSGAVFGLYTKDDIKGYDGKVLVKAGTLVEKATSDTDGLAKFKADLPLVNYEVKELQAPIGYSSSDEVVPFDATYKGQDVVDSKLDKEFFNKIIEVDISKVDITDNSEIEGAQLTIYEKGDKGATFDTWVSGQDGKDEEGNIIPHRIKGLEVGKTYVLHETSSPYGFALSQDVEFTIEDTGEVQKVEMKDELVYGTLTWNKTGEIFMSTDTGANEFGTVHTPVWEESNILGSEITIYANQDIKIGNTLYYEKDQVVETLESDWESVTSKKLPVGIYYYMETKVPHGYIADTNKHFFEVKDNQKTDLQELSSTLDNKRPTFDIDMTKVMEKQEVFKDEDAYKDVAFGIFAREDIYNYMGEVAIENGTMVGATGITKEGHLVNVPDLPNGVYYIKELATNSQYKLNEKEYDFEIAYHGENVTNYVVHIGVEGKVENELARGQINVHKLDTLDEENKAKDKTNTDEVVTPSNAEKAVEVTNSDGEKVEVNKRLVGIEFNISAKEDMSEVLATVKTDEKGIASFKDLELGTYYIQEVGQVDGYTLNDNIYKVEVTTDGDLLDIEVENKPTEMTFSKVNETGKEELEGAKLTVIDKETGEVVEEWVSTKESHIIHYLVEGKEYIMREITAPEGYELAEEIVFTAGDGNKVTMKDELAPKPETGVDTSTSGMAGMLGLGLLGAFLLIKGKKKNEEVA